jgi:predicted transcriptional regulator
MRLAEYLKQNDLTPEMFAEMADIHFTTVYRLIAGDSMPKRSTIRAIFEATKGQVRAIDLIEDEEERKVG